MRLTKRETEVLSLIATGISNKQAADILFINKRTVDFHMLNISAKLKTHNRVSSINEARRLGLISAT